jgi:chromosome partitioning protein
MALIISVVMLKGGVAKTTTAVALAEAASVGGPVVLLDADPMGAAVRWSVLADQSGHGLASNVIGMPAANLPKRITALARDVACVIVDAPPPGALHIARGAVQVANVVVMPCSPQLADLDRVRATAAEAASQDVPAYAVLTMTRATADRDAARAALASWGVPAFATELPLTVQVGRGYGRAVSGPLARYGAALLSEVLDVIKGGNDA